MPDADELRKKADEQMVTLRHNKRNADRWDEFVRVMGETEVFNPDVFKHWKEVMIRLDKRIEECKTNSNGISMKDDWVEYKFQMRLVPELQKIKEGIKDGKEKESHKEKETPVPTVRKTVHL